MITEVIYEAGDQNCDEGFEDGESPYQMPQKIDKEALLKKEIENELKKISDEDNKISMITDIFRGLDIDFMKGIYDGDTRVYYKKLVAEFMENALGPELLFTDHNLYDCTRFLEYLNQATYFLNTAKFKEYLNNHSSNFSLVFKRISDIVLNHFRGMKTFINHEKTLNYNINIPQSNLTLDKFSKTVKVDVFTYFFNKIKILEKNLYQFQDLYAFHVDAKLNHKKIDTILNKYVDEYVKVY